LLGAVGIVPAMNRTSSYNLAYFVPVARGTIFSGDCLLPLQHGLWPLQEASRPAQEEVPDVVVPLGGNASSHGRQLLAFGTQRQLFDRLS